MRLDFWTLGFQAVNFLVLLFVLHRYLWKPVTAVIEQRKKEIDDAAGEAAAKATAADESRRSFEAKAESIDRDRARVLAEAAAELAAERQKSVAEMRAAADVDEAAARARLGEERRAAEADLADDAVDLAIALAKRLLDDVCGGALADAFLDRICEHVEGLSEDGLAPLRAQIAANPVVQVATSPALDDAARTRLRARLEKRLGAVMKLEFVTDHALIAGAELRFAHARIGDSFRHSLNAAKKELLPRREPVVGGPLRGDSGIKARAEISGR